MEDVLFVGTGRWIAALDRGTGRPVWRVKLPRWFSSGPVTILAEGGQVFVGRGGYVYCLDSENGQVLWERGIGSASDSVLMAVPGLSSDNAAVAAHAAAQQSAAAATITTTG
jgi:outer membrane protein assembly factor BamB